MTMHWLSVTVAMLMTLSAAAHDDQFPGRCQGYRSVSRTVGQCQPGVSENFYSDLSIGPSTIRFLNSLPCQNRNTIDVCLRLRFIGCGNKQTILDGLEETRALCNGTNLAGWFEDAMTSLEPVPLQCAHELIENTQQVCQDQLTPTPTDYGIGLEHGMSMSETFLQHLVNCVLGNKDAIFNQSTSCAGLDKHRAIFSLAFFSHGLPGDLFTMKLHAVHIGQLRNTLLPFDQAPYF